PSANALSALRSSAAIALGGGGAGFAGGGGTGASAAGSWDATGFDGSGSFGAVTDIGALVGGSATDFSGATPPLNDGRNRHASANASSAMPAALPSTFCLMTKSLPGMPARKKCSSCGTLGHSSPALQPLRRLMQRPGLASGVPQSHGNAHACTAGSIHPPRSQAGSARARCL